MTIIIQQRLEDVGAEINSLFNVMYMRCENLRNEAASADTDIQKWLDLKDLLVKTVTRLDTLKDVSGLMAYYRIAYDNPTYDIGAEYTATRAAIVTVYTTINAATPEGTATMETDANNVSIPRRFTVAQSAGVRSDIATLLGTMTRMII